MLYKFIAFNILIPLKLYSVVLDDFTQLQPYNIQDPAGNNIQVTRIIEPTSRSLLNILDNLTYNEKRSIIPRNTRKKISDAHRINYEFTPPINFNVFADLQLNFKKMSHDFRVLFIALDTNHTYVVFSKLFQCDQKTQILKELREPFGKNYQVSGDIDYTQIQSIHFIFNILPGDYSPDLTFELTSLELIPFPKPFSMSTLESGTRKRK